MSLEASFALGLGALALDVDLRCPAGAVTAVLGPNGAGKTTLLRAIAGSVAVDAGHIALDGRTLDAPPGTFVPPEQRRLGIVHQDHLLLPHLSALDNVAFGPRSRGAGAAEARALAAAMLERMGLTALSGAKPRALSGGQAQRIALARALVTEPDALLLDEPLASLDPGTRVEVRRDLRRLLAAVAGPTLLVTHDPVDVLALADHVAVLEGGRITQSGAIASVTAQPRTRYVAELLGTNLIRGDAAGTTITTDAGAQLIAAAHHDGAVFATIAPAAIALHRREPEGSPRNRWRTSVAHIDVLGDRVRVQLGDPLPMVAEVTAPAIAALELREGDAVWVSIKATEVATYPA